MDELKASLDTISNTAKGIIDGIESRCPELFQPAYYDDAALKLYINPDTPDSEAFAAIAAEMPCAVSTPRARMTTTGRRIF